MPMMFIKILSILADTLWNFHEYIVKHKQIKNKKKIQQTYIIYKWYVEYKKI